MDNRVQFCAAMYAVAIYSLCLKIQSHLKWLKCKELSHIGPTYIVVAYSQHNRYHNLTRLYQAAKLAPLTTERKWWEFVEDKAHCNTLMLRYVNL